ncbi:MAG: YlxR family protein [Chloroflexi bacterium]|nr:YlxR family protein [Chloroflexota bacterium]GIW12020.1 MAG: hypothetical protein KatS3mg061_3077 [Dehalococcoidia bacterium]
MAGGPRRTRHIPIRMCVACRQSSAKRALVRLVRDRTGAVVVDPTGKHPGRGAYLCPLRPCWEMALRRGSLEQALKARLSPEEVTRLREQAATYPEAAPAP